MDQILHNYSTTECFCDIANKKDVLLVWKVHKQMLLVFSAHLSLYQLSVMLTLSIIELKGC